MLTMCPWLSFSPHSAGRSTSMTRLSWANDFHQNPPPAAPPPSPASVGICGQLGSLISPNFPGANDLAVPFTNAVPPAWPEGCTQSPTLVSYGTSPPLGQTQPYLTQSRSGGSYDVLVFTAAGIWYLRAHLVFHFSTPGSGQNNLGDYVYGYFTAWGGTGDRCPLVGNNSRCGYIEWNDDPTAPPTPATSVGLSWCHRCRGSNTHPLTTATRPLARAPEPRSAMKTAIGLPP
jgi:hypothetical protein